MSDIAVTGSPIGSYKEEKERRKGLEGKRVKFNHRGYLSKFPVAYSAV